MGTISTAHAEFLTSKGVVAEVAERFQLATVDTVEHLPKEFEDFPIDLAPGLPGLIFWWTEPDGTMIPQLKVIEQQIEIGGKPAKYVWPRGRAAKLGVFREPVDSTSPVLIVEGTKQSLVAAQYAPIGTAVYGIAGCRMWTTDGVPTPHLQVADGRDVVVLLDADASTNPDVYEAGIGLREACEAEGATSVRFARLPGGGKSSLDDYLGERAEDRRAATLARIIDGAKAKPADKVPTRKAKQADRRITAGTGDERPVVVVNEDRWIVINNLTKALLGRWNAVRLFNYGGVICQRVSSEMKPVERGTFNDVIQETMITVNRVDHDSGPVDSYAWPDVPTMQAVLSRAEAFVPLDKLSSIPFLRADGTVCAHQGYDEASRTFLTLTPELEGIDVPEEPTPGQVKAAVELLTLDLLQGFPFPGEADMANAIATLLTPFVRHLVPTSPLGIIDGKEAGSGKNLFADVVALVVTGRAADPLPYTTDDDEQRKVITSTFRTGASLFVFDEAHRIEGPSMARALTGHTYKDRVLGGNQMAEFPNNVTWLSLGNQVQVVGDMARRVYRVRMDYAGESPENRPESDFKHPDLRGWVREHRAELVRACLTIVRSWFAASRPVAAVPFRMGSFETWQGMIAGILENAGVTGFLAGMKEWRSESDFERQHWVAHLRWLSDTFGEREFTSAEATRKLLKDAEAEYPHGMTDASKPGFTRELGVAYRKQAGRTLDGLRLVLAGERMGKSKVTRWRIEGGSPFSESGISTVEPSPQSGEDGGREGDPSTFACKENTLTTPSDAHVTHEARVRAHTGVEPAGIPSPPPDSPARRLITELSRDGWAMPCPECGTPYEAFGSAGILWACRSCHPSTFGVAPG